MQESRRISCDGLRRPFILIPAAADMKEELVAEIFLCFHTLPDEVTDEVKVSQGAVRGSQIAEGGCDKRRQTTSETTVAQTL